MCEETNIDLKIENVIHGLRAYGYLVTAKPLPGHECGFLNEMREGLRKADETLADVQRHFRCRGRSQRALRLTRHWLPEPTWGVMAPEERRNV